MLYNFEWNLDKAKKNIHKHNISFERASSVFRDPNAISIVDEEHSKKEERWLTIGLDSNGVLLVVSHTFKTESITTTTCTIRIISARKADTREMQYY